MPKFTAHMNHGKGITGKYKMRAANKTEARKVCPNKRKISKITYGW